MNPLAKPQLRCAACGVLMVRDQTGRLVHADGLPCTPRSCPSCGGPLLVDPASGQLEHTKPVCFNAYAFGIPGGVS